VELAVKMESRPWNIVSATISVNSWLRVLIIFVDSQSKSVIINYANPEEIREKEDWFAESDEMKRYG